VVVIQQHIGRSSGRSCAGFMENVLCASIALR
jgi:hypothetical protein